VRFLPGLAIVVYIQSTAERSSSELPYNAPSVAGGRSQKAGARKSKEQQDQRKKNDGKTFVCGTCRAMETRNAELALPENKDPSAAASNHQISARPPKETGPVFPFTPIC